MENSKIVIKPTKPFCFSLPPLPAVLSNVSEKTPSLDRALAMLAPPAVPLAPSLLGELPGRGRRPDRTPNTRGKVQVLSRPPLEPGMVHSGQVHAQKRPHRWAERQGRGFE